MRIDLFAPLARPAAAAAVAAVLLALPANAQQRPMTFMDMQVQRSGGSWAPSPDGQWMLYTIRTPDWQEAESQTDIHVVSLEEGVTSSRQLTYTDDKNETQPTWAPDGSWFVFASNRDSDNDDNDGNQLYMMRHDGGEARKITDADGGVSGFDFSPNGRWMIYRSGEAGQQQLYRMAVADLPGGDAEQMTSGDAGVEEWDWSPDGSTLYFVRPDAFDDADRRRRDAGFTVDVRNQVTSLSSLWAMSMDTGLERMLEHSEDYSVDNFNVSDDGRWISFTGGSVERYERNITASRLYADQYLLELASGHVERLTDNYEVGESGTQFSPDGRWIAFSAPDEMERYSMTENRIYIRAVEDRGGAFRKLGSSFDQSLSVGFWAEDSKTIFFNTGVTVTNQLHALDIERDEVRQVTNERAVVSVNRDEDTGVILINYQDPMTPPTVFTVEDFDDVDDRDEWVQLVDVNPQVAELALGREVEVNWTSTDGKTVGGVLVYPVGYQEGTRYPLIVAIHGGPASADVLRFNGGYGAQVYAGAGYAVLKPNYRGSRNYGNAHRTDIVGDYFTLGYDDIMTGVDYLIDEGIVDGERMGALGWSAGGHWSNWILTQTDRFKAISSGAGTMNWISMYAQSDVQRNRQFYVGDGFLYEDFDTYFDQSPLKYITNASTPTMIHVVEGDPRVPSPQSVELHMALKKLDVPTELFMYPGRSHGIPDPRNRLVKAVSEMAWMDHYVRGIGDKFEWEQVLETLEAEAEDARPVSYQ
ncbi:MAG: prolyl oligopeptidase family serine peptidase [Gemmatimonadota bacterium]|nr:prolyl oligopeptidase family serine peptidase [Gemmatimonadota bacterium]MDE3013253.1 prolyl oligopeptidase family serine peptidase [Gemmatimonadota bacterium]